MARADAVRGVLPAARPRGGGRVVNNYCEDCKWFGARREGQTCASVSCLHPSALVSGAQLCRDEQAPSRRDNCADSRRSYGHCEVRGRHYEPRVPPPAEPAAPVVVLSRWRRFCDWTAPRFVTATLHVIPTAFVCGVACAIQDAREVPAWFAGAVASAACWGALRPFAWMTEKPK